MGEGLARSSGARGRQLVALLLCLAGVATVLIVGAAASSARWATASAFGRVNQVGYPSGAGKRAYLVAGTDESGASFSVMTSSGRTVFTAPTGTSLGSWSRTYKFVYPLDFDT